jgi:hypothetical protein
MVTEEGFGQWLADAVAEMTVSISPVKSAPGFLHGEELPCRCWPKGRNTW